MARKEESIDLVLGVQSKGYHQLINKEGERAFLSSTDIRRLAQKDNVVIHMREEFGPVTYLIGTEPLKRLEGKLWAKFHQMSSDLSSWVVQESRHLNLDFINNSCDRMFKSKHILVGNIPPDYFAGGRMSEDNIAKVKRAVERSFPMAKVSPHSLELLRGKKKHYLNPRDFGVTNSRNGRVSVVVEIEEKLVGIGIRNGIQLFNRVRVDVGVGEGGEYFTRTLLDESEARIYRNLMRDPKEVALATFRLPFYSSEMVDLARRTLKNTLEQALGTRVDVIPMTFRHKFEGSSNEKEETVLVVLTEFAEMNSILADIIGLPSEEEGAFMLRVGSIELQGHRSVGSIWGKELLKSDHRINTVILGESDNNTDMMGIFNEIREQEDVLALVKRYSQKGLPEWLVVKQEPADTTQKIEEKLDRGSEFRIEHESTLTTLTWTNGSFQRNRLPPKRGPPSGTDGDGFRAAKKKKGRKPDLPSVPLIVTSPIPIKGNHVGAVGKLDTILEEDNGDQEEEWEPVEVEGEEQETHAQAPFQATKKKSNKKPSGKKNQRKEPKTPVLSPQRDTEESNVTAPKRKGVNEKSTKKLPSKGEAAKKRSKGGAGGPEKTSTQMLPSPPPPKPPNEKEHDKGDPPPTRPHPSNPDSLNVGKTKPSIRNDGLSDNNAK